LRKRKEWVFHIQHIYDHVYIYLFHKLKMYRSSDGKGFI
jgi:hypothetical protein